MKQHSQNRGNLLLQKWLNGSITWQEERELEQLTNGYAMLTDALEGYRTSPERDYMQQVAQLKKRLQERTERRRRGFVFYLPRIAAAAAMVGALAFGIWYVAGNGVQKPVVAQQEASREPREASREPQEPQTQNPKPETSESDAVAFENKKTAHPPPNITIPQTPSLDNTSITTPTDTILTIAEADVPTVETETPTVDAPRMDRAKASEEVRALQKPDVARSVAPNRIILGDRVISGKLTDVNGAPLVGAVIAVPGAGSSVVTGLDGDFKLPVAQDTKELVFSYTGFQTATVPLSNNDTMNVKLKEGATTLSEVVVSGYNAQKKQAPSDTKEAPAPRGGFDKLTNYLQKNLRYPQAAKDANVEGTVIVAFVIKANGSLADFEIVESLGYGCDEEAIRLLKAGPKWEMRNKVLQGDTATYPVEFKLK